MLASETKPLLVHPAGAVVYGDKPGTDLPWRRRQSKRLAWLSRQSTHDTRNSRLSPAFILLVTIISAGAYLAVTTEVFKTVGDRHRLHQGEAPDLEEGAAIPAREDMRNSDASSERPSPVLREGLLNHAVNQSPDFDEHGFSENGVSETGQVEIRAGSSGGGDNKSSPTRRDEESGQTREEIVLEDSRAEERGGEATRRVGSDDGAYKHTANDLGRKGYEGYTNGASEKMVESDARKRAPGGADDAGKSSVDGDQRKKPNVFFFMIDDMGWNDIGYQSTDLSVFTPNLDKLAAGGIKLSNYYSASSCTPARASLMTGRYPVRYGLQYKDIGSGMPFGLLLSEKILPEYFNEEGYESHMVGKWNLGTYRDDMLPHRRGFETFLGYLATSETYWYHKATDIDYNNQFFNDFGFGNETAYYDVSRNRSFAQLDSHATHTKRDEAFTASRHGKQSPRQSSSYVTWTDSEHLDEDREERSSWASANIPMGDSLEGPSVRATLRGADTLREDGETVAIMGTTAANEHAYLEVFDEAAMDYDGLYSEDVFLARATRIIENKDPWDEEPLFLYVAHQSVHSPISRPPKGAFSKEEQALLDEFDDSEGHPYRKNFASAVLYLDKAVGIFLDTLEARGWMENAIIVVASDNGACVSTGGTNYPLRGAKKSLFEGGSKVPSINLFLCPLPVDEGHLLHWEQMWTFSPDISYVGNGGVERVNADLPAFVYSTSHIPEELWGTTYSNIVHVTDWLPTLMSAVNGTVEGSAGPLDGVDHWGKITGLGADEADPPRSEILYNWDSYTLNSINRLTRDDTRAQGAFRQGKWKLIKNSWCSGYYSYDRLIRDPLLNAQAVCHRKMCVECEGHCEGSTSYHYLDWLFDLEADPRETTNLLHKHPEIAARLEARAEEIVFAEFTDSVHAPIDEKAYEKWIADGWWINPWVPV